MASASTSLPSCKGICASSTHGTQVELWPAGGNGGPVAPEHRRRPPQGSQGLSNHRPIHSANGCALQSRRFGCVWFGCDCTRHVVCRDCSLSDFWGEGCQL